MTDYHGVTSNDTDSKIPMYPALKVMERQLPPVKYGRDPYWRAPITPPSRDVYIPVWNWYSPHEIPANHSPLTLDTNGAYMAAMGGVDVAHANLTHTGPFEGNFPEPRKVLPGYYKITVPYWAFSGTIVSPLGDSSRVESEDTLWVAAPTLTLLLELLEAGTLGTLEVLDSWTTQVTTNFRSWNSRLKAVRNELLDNIDRAETDAAFAYAREKYGAFKEGYSAALSMMLTGERCKSQRPDWAHTIYAQHAASQWRKAWKYTGTGHPLVSMGAVDEITIVAADLPEVMSRPKPPFTYDDTGRKLGALKPKPAVATDPAAQQVTDLPLIDEDDIL